MKYAIWRHENALGNSAEHTVGLSKHLYRTNDEDPQVFVETEFQRDFALCIKGITPDRVHMFEASIFDGINGGNIVDIFKERLYSKELYKDVHMPPPYSYNGLMYDAMWEHLEVTNEAQLEFPFELHEDKYNIPKDAILIQIREPNTYWKRVDGANSEPSRFVEKQTFFDIALHYANLGHKVVRIGDIKQTPMPYHKNIIDLAKIEGRTMMDDLYALATCKVFLSCDSGIWPMAGGMKKNLVLSNVTSAFNKKSIVDWLPSDTSTVLFKHRVGGIRDNSFEELKNSVDKFL
tara:strand:- start:640 stop:1512 length:873 start_codon:yes stop_codon:yes gene_type:complete